MLERWVVNLLTTVYTFEKPFKKGKARYGSHSAGSIILLQDSSQ